MRKLISTSMILLVVLSTFSIFGPKVKTTTDLVSLPAGAKNIDPSNLDLDDTRLLIDVDVAGSGQTAYVNPGETVSGSLTYQIYSGAGNPSEINQGFFIMSWTSIWPAPSEYYIPIWNGISSVYPGVINTESFSFTAPSDPGTYYLYWCGGAEYNMADAVVRYNQPLTFPAHAKIVVAGESICTWHSMTPLRNPSTEHRCAVHENKIYVVGGTTPTSGERYDRVLYGSVQPNGHIDSDGWQYTTPLPPDETGQSERSRPAVVLYEDWIYVLGGSAEEPPHRIERDTVWFAPFSPDGTIGGWTETTRMPYRSPEVAVQWNGKIYILAGWDGYSQHNDVHFAEINPDGTLGSWTRTTSLPEVRAHGHQAVVHNGVIYFIGGTTGYTGPPHIHNEVYYAAIQPSGEVGAWTETAPLPVGLEGHVAAVYDDDIFVLGGISQPVYPEEVTSDKMYKAHINPDGSLSSWEEYCVLPEPLTHVGSVVLNGRIYVIGGHREDGSLADTVYFTSLFPAMLSASADIKPDTLNLRSRGKWIACYVELPEGYNVNDVDVSTILLNDTVPVDPDAPTAVGDYDEDDIPDLMGKFDRAMVIEYIKANVNMTELYEERFMTITLTITGYLDDGTPFDGSDTVRIMMPGAKGPGKHTLRK